MEVAGYSEQDIEHIKNRIEHYLKLREIIRKASGEAIDLKPYEADMRHLVDQYIQAEESVVISPFGNMPILDIIEKSGIENAINELPEGIKGNKEAVAETIENNVRSRIIKDHLLDPAYFENMSKLLDEIIKERKQKAVDYQIYLQKIADLANKVTSGAPDDMPKSLNTKAKRALYNNLGQDEGLALQIDAAITISKSDSWRGNQVKENDIKRAIYRIVNDVNEVETYFRYSKTAT